MSQEKTFDKYSKESFVAAIDGLSSDSGKDGLLHVLDLVGKYHPSFDLYVLLIEQAQALNEDESLTNEELRTIFEQAVRICGTDVVTGSEVWKKYIDFETDEHEDLIESEEEINPEDCKKSKERFIKLFHRVLSLPLVGNEQILVSFEGVLGNFCGAEDVDLIKPDLLNKKVQDAINFRESRLVYEMHLHSDKHTNSSEAEKVSSWKAYIKFEHDEKQVSRMQRLYERAVLSCPNSLELWMDYLIFALTSLKNYGLAVLVSERALHFHQYSPWLLKLRLICQQADGPNTDHRAAMVEEFQQAIASRFYDVQDCVDYMLVYCNVWRRLIDQSIQKITSPSSSTSAIEMEQTKYEENQQYLQYALNQIETFLSTSYDSWTAAWWRFTKYSAEMQFSRLRRIEEIPQLATSSQQNSMDGNNRKNNNQKPWRTKSWDTFTAKFPQTYWSWQEAIQWFASKGEYEHSRACFRKILHVHLDTSSIEVAKDWFRFEDDYGDVNSLVYCISRIATIIDLVALTSTTAADTAVTQASTTQPAAQEDSKSATTKSKKRSAEQFDAVDSQSTKKKAKATSSTEHNHTAPPEKSEDAETSSSPSNIILVRNLPFNAKEGDLQVFFKKVLPFSQMTCLLSKAGKFRGMVKIEIEDEALFQTLLNQQQEIEFEGRKLHILNYEGSPEATQEKKLKEVNMMAKGVMAAAHSTTVFLNSLSPDITDTDLLTLFADCGQILGARVALDKMTGESKGTALVQFTTEEGRNAALKFNKTEWKGKLIYVNASRFALLPTTAVEEGVKDGTGEQSTSIVDIPSPPAVHDVLPQQAIVEEQVAAKPAVKENPYLAHQQEEKSDVKKPDVAKKLTSLTTTMFKPRGLNKSK